MFGAFAFDVNVVDVGDNIRRIRPAGVLHTTPRCHTQHTLQLMRQFPFAGFAFVA
jgi:hypothetical protein